VPGPEISINPTGDSIGSKYSRREKREGEKLPGHCVELARTRAGGEMHLRSHYYYREN